MAVPEELRQAGGRRCSGVVGFVPFYRPRPVQCNCTGSTRHTAVQYNPSIDPALRSKSQYRSSLQIPETDRVSTNISEPTAIQAQWCYDHSWINAPHPLCSLPSAPSIRTVYSAHNATANNAAANNAAAHSAAHCNHSQCTTMHHSAPQCCTVLHSAPQCCT